ncbi:MAG: VOC family protein [Acutalibacteraceae bacterium]|nr:VOC family protein [Acutalibacteraceae bacterium]
MKSNEVKLSNNLSCVVEALQEVEHASAQAGFNREQTNVLRLLTEEMISMTTDILTNCKGALWMEWEGSACQLHLTAVAPMEGEAKAAFIEASKAKVNAPVKGLKNKISALLAGMLSREEHPKFYMSMSTGFIGGMPTGMPSMRNMAPVWSLVEYEKSQPKEKKQAEMEGVEKSILIGLADDIVVSMKNHWVELVVKKQFSTPVQAAMPKFTGLSHVCIFVDDMMEAVDYYQKLLGVVPDHYLSHWKNEGFFKAGGFIEEAAQGDVSIAFVNVPGTKLTLELMQYHYPQGRKEPVFFAANDVSGARHVALKITNIDEAFLHIKAMPDTRLINQTEDYRVFQISETSPSEVRFFDQDLQESDDRNIQTAKILSGVRYFYFIDKYGLQWEFEQGHTDIGD